MAFTKNNVFKMGCCFNRLLILLILIACNKSFSNSKDSLKRVRIGVLPSAYYTPETRLGLGSLVYTLFKANKLDSFKRKSNTQSYLSYTANKQFAFENDYQVWLNQGSYYFTGALDYSRFPQYFYGIGNDTREDDKLMMSFNSINIQTKNFVRLGKDIYGGLFFHYKNLFNQDVKLMSSIAGTEIYGNMGFEAKGIGPIFVIDKRDNPLNPAKGGYLEVSYVDYKSIIRNQNMFRVLTIDARKYATFFKRLTWNGNIYITHNEGEVPYKMLAEIGGARFLRGYYKGRFRDNNLIVVQHEFRMPVYKMLGLAVFSGIGSVAKTPSQFITNTVHYNYGAGLRIRLNKKDNSNIRIDYGITRDSHGLYVVFAEAF